MGVMAVCNLRLNKKSVSLLLITTTTAFFIDMLKVGLATPSDKVTID